MLASLRTMLTVSYLPLYSSVARLDTTSPAWSLYLDSESPVEDHCWAMIDVLRILTHGVHAAESAMHVPLLRVVRG